MDNGKRSGEEISGSERSSDYDSLEASESTTSESPSFHELISSIVRASQSAHSDYKNNRNLESIHETSSHCYSESSSCDDDSFVRVKNIQKRRHQWPSKEGAYDSLLTTPQNDTDVTDPASNPSSGPDFSESRSHIFNLCPQRNNSTTIQSAVPGRGFIPGIQFAFASGAAATITGGTEQTDVDDEDEPLAIAVMVDSSSQQRSSLPAAVEYTAKPPLLRNRRFQCYVGALLCLIVIILGIAAVGIVNNNRRRRETRINNVPTIPPTPSPSESPSSSEEAVFRLQFTEAVGPQVNVDGSAHDRAAKWIIFEDAMSLSSVAENLIQRYLLALFYFTTTENEVKQWKSCNRPRRSGQDHTCDFQRWMRRQADDQVFYQPEKATRWLSNTHECEWIGVICDDIKIMRALELWGQEMEGTFPSEVGAFQFLQSISFAYNKFNGTIPPELADMRHLINIELHGNQFTGTIPNQYWRATTLQNINLEDNRLTGTISAEGVRQLTSLKGLHLSTNQLTGSIPTQVGELQFLAFFRLFGNALTGTIPTELANLVAMQELWLMENDLSGSIPNQIGSSLSNLENLRLNHNRLTGTIPSQVYENMPLLTELALDKNKLTGTLSEQIERLGKLTMIYVSRNHLTGTIPTQMVNLRFLRVAWLHLNAFEGSVPEGLCSRIEPGFIEVLQADCGPHNPSVQCDCCTSCCDRSSEICRKTRHVIINP